MYFIDFFLGGEFMTYGSDVLNYTGMESEDRPDPMKTVFPKVTKCTFHKYGASGTIEKKDGLCVLPLNIINEKIFIFVWFWMILLAVVTGMFVVYRFVTLIGSKMRTNLIVWHVSDFILLTTVLEMYTVLHLILSESKHKKGHVIDTFWL